MRKVRRLTTNSMDRDLGLPAWLARRPQDHRAAWLWWRGAARLWSLLLIATLATAALGLVLGRWGIVAALAHHPAALAGISLLLALSAGARRRQRLERLAERSWVASLPSAASVAERIVLVPLLFAAVLAALLCWGGLFQGLGSLALACAGPVLGGACVGVLLAVLLPQSLLGSAQTDRPTVWLKRPLAGARASLLPLGHWPAGRKQTWARRKVLARGCFVILMSIPMTESQGGFTQIALGSVALWFIGHHLVTLLLALCATAFPAARWLAPTPLGGLRFAVYLGYRIWFKEALAAVFLACAAMVLDNRLTPSWGALLVLGWVAACVVLGFVVCHLGRLQRVLISPLHRWMR